MYVTAYMMSVSCYHYLNKSLQSITDFIIISYPYTQNQHIIHNMSFNQIKGMKIVNISSSTTDQGTHLMICIVVFVYIFSMWMSWIEYVNRVVLWCDMRRSVYVRCWLKRKWNYIKLAPHFHFPFSVLYLWMMRRRWWSPLLWICVCVCITLALCDYWLW